jgi:hypothetical protein
MRGLISFLVLLITVVSNAQQKEGVVVADYKGLCIASYPRIQLNGSSEDIIRNYLKHTIRNLEDVGCDLQLNYVQNSLAGLHYSFMQTYNGVVVYQSEIKVNLDKKNIIRSVFDNSFDTKNWDIPAGSYSLASVIILHPETGKAVVAEKKLEKGIELLFVDGEIVYQRDTRSYFAQDSTVVGNVFNPDPLTTLQQPYTAGTYDDNNDANTPWLNNQLTPVFFKANFNGTVFSLENSYFKIVDIDSPQVLPVVSSTPVFNFNRSQTGFEDVNAFYHLNRYREHVQSLGFNLADYFILVDTHAWGGADQSSFSFNGGNPELDFGVGGVDDAEDADVLVHEYGHFLSYNAAPGSNIGNQRNSLDEAFGDYIAASYSAALSNYNNDWVFNWDGPVWSNNNLGGRTVASTKVYPTDLTSGIYKNAPIWSTALMNIHHEIGRAATDSLIYQTHYSYAANISMADAARLLIDADTLLNNGAYYCPIYKHLLERGLVDFYTTNPCGISSVREHPLLNVQFKADNIGFTLSNLTDERVQLSIFNTSGQLLYINDLDDTNFIYSNTNLCSGFYLVEVKGQTATRTFKWVKGE